MPAKTKMIETFLSVLKNKKSLPNSIKKFYEFFLIKKAFLSPTGQISARSLLLGAKIQNALSLQKIKFHPQLKNSLLVSFLKDIDKGKKINSTNYYRFLSKYGGADFANIRTKSFEKLYREAQRGEELKPILVYEDISDWKGYLPDFPKGNIIKGNKNGYVIFDGHHRGSILIQLGYRKIPVKFIKKDPLVDLLKFV